jgi:hypothetical protein
MTVCFELFAHEKDSGSFGQDGVYLPDQKIILQNPSDTTQVVFGPVVVSWKGRLIQMPVTIRRTSPLGQIRFRVKNGSVISNSINYITIVTPEPKLSVSGSSVIGDPLSSNGRLTTGNTLVVEGLEMIPNGSNNKIVFSTNSPDTTLNGNPRYHPVIILSRGPVTLSGVELSVSADSLNGGPGGGGGGAGFAKSGGKGFTGGGSDSGITETNIGSGDGPSFQIDGSYTGGASLTGVVGGASDFDDQGGGGGTGSPFGSSGKNGRENNPSHKGGAGGASAGGETLDLPYGGGGGGFITRGRSGAGVGDNGGEVNGGRFLVPLQGGSGGAAGNCYECTDSLTGSGGGGGGAISIISYDKLTLSNVSFTANGANGTSPVTRRQAGGGGGSGGAIHLTARNGTTLRFAALKTKGGFGGLGGEDIELDAIGGDGGHGIVRIDGDTSSTFSTFDAGSIASGPTLHVPTTAVSAVGLKLSGTAGNMFGLKDSIRIYYRSSRSAWKYIDTVRITDTYWEKHLTTDFDSVLYVTVMQKTEDPQRRFANYEPDWLLSHLSSGIIKLIPRPRFTYSLDTVRIGCTKVDTCESTTFYLYNIGSLPLTLDSLKIANPDFTLSTYSSAIPAFSSDSIKVTYCPKKVGLDTTILTFFTNDSTYKVVIIGCGTSKDLRITLLPTSHNFGRRELDSCYRTTITIRGEGDDPVTIFPNQFSNSQFRVISPLTPVTLSRGQTAQFIIEFCPKDTGFVRASVILTEQRDSFVVTGTGILKMLTSVDTLPLGVLCKGRCIDTSITVTATGNEFVTISGINGATLLSSGPVILPPNEQTTIRFRLCPDSLTQSEQRISIISDADSSNTTLCTFLIADAGLTLNSPLEFKGICLGGKDTMVRSFRNSSLQGVTVSSVSLRSNTAITSSALSTPHNVAAGDSVRLEFYSDPPTPGVYTDTLDLTVSSNGCDTVLSFVIIGFASSGEPLFSRKELDFGVVDTGNCMRDSLIISNVCLSPVTITIPSASGSFTLISGKPSTLTIPGEKSDTLIYEYCPGSSNADSITITFKDGLGTSFPVTLRGSGRVKASVPHYYISLPKENAVAGSLFDYTVMLDSAIDAATLDSMTLTLTYDPIVIQPMSITSGSIATVKRGKETTPGTYTFTVEKVQPAVKRSIAVISMMPLLSKHTTTPVTATNIITNPTASTTISEGSVTVERCEDPPTNIIIPGDFSLDLPSPNPTSAMMTLRFEIGAAGKAHIVISSTTGTTVIEKNVVVTKGMNEFSLDLSSLPSGRYSVAVDSWGWRSTRPIVIIK